MSMMRVRTLAVALAAAFMAAPASAQIVLAPAPADSPVREVTHTVKPGDTLWDLARQYLNDPFRWPEVFRRNTAIVENPHRIYPGEVIRIPTTAVRAEVLAEAERTGTVVSTVLTRPAQGTNTVFGQPFSSASSTRLEVSQRVATGTVRRGEVDVAPFVVSGRARNRRFDGQITGSAERPGIEMDVRSSRFQLNDRIYISTTGSRPPIGARFTALAYGPQVMDSAQLMIPTAILRVEETDPGRPIMARVIRQFDEITVDQPILVYGGESLGGGLAVPFAGSLEGRVVWVHGDPVLPSLQHYIVIETRRAVARVGDRFGLLDQTTRGASDPTQPPEWAAMAQVVRVTPFAATAMIVDHELPRITAGMKARLVERVP